ncbi:MAG: tetraacyldisaccharide 4'-kinase [Minwuia sp.]|uniref:tetraacyldisaccharide 4'-kinase n=1 Tax=Minwuia sp. TaxID=2493630 RepID=UPI003A84E482
MRAPGFWRRGGARLPGLLLSPLGWVWQTGAALKRMGVRPRTAPRPVVCVGNLTAGGAGKTPTVMLIASWFRDRGVTPGVLLRGYGGSLSGSMPVPVDPATHTAAEVGDEALLHSRLAPTVICTARVAGAEALAAHCDVILMDDGHQNFALIKDLSIVVADAVDGFGNGRILPAGPLRESIAAGLGRANALIAIGDGMPDPRIKRASLPVLRGRLVPSDDAERLSGRRVLGFSGIGRPQKFRDTLEQLGAEITGFEAFADHHPYTAAEVDRLKQAAAHSRAELVTTAKDAVRLTPDMRDGVGVVDIRLALDQPDMLDRLLDPVLAAVSKRGSGGAPTSTS